jgi:RNA polymerase sigma factor (TIGR02999 family)
MSSNASKVAAAPDGQLADLDPSGLRELVDVLYADLRRIARRERFRAKAGATLCTTALINEAWLKLQRRREWRDEGHFLATAALAMRQVLVNDVLARRAEKRNHGIGALPLDEAVAVPDADDERLLQVNQAVERLAGLSPRLAQVVECRYFAGYCDEQTARALGINARTVRRDWIKARAWLYTALVEEGSAGAEPRGP